MWWGSAPPEHWGSRVTSIVWEDPPDWHEGQSSTNLDWEPILERAAEIVNSMETGVTLRQLFYILVSERNPLFRIPNVHSKYTYLSKKTSAGRRAGTFPDLLDRVSRIERFMYFTGPAPAKRYLRNMYRRDRTEGQPYTIYLGVEKAGISEQLDAWFTDPLGIPHVALGGYPSQSLCDLVRRDVEYADRPSVLIYAGDHDPSGVDMLRDFQNRTQFDEVIRVALNPEQVQEFELVESVEPEVFAKLEDDPRAQSFIRKFGSLVQFEVDAIPPDDLHNLYQDALENYWDADAFEEVLEQEQADMEVL